MNIVFFETTKEQSLSPVTLTRASFDIMCGGATLYAAAKLVLGPQGISYIVRPHIKKITEQKFQVPKRASDTYLFLRASIVPDISALNKLFKQVAKKKSFVVKDKTEIVAAYFSGKELGVSHAQIKKLSIDNVEDFLRLLKLKNFSIKLSRFQYLWDIIIYNKKIIIQNMNTIKENYDEVQDNVYVGRNVHISENTSFNTSHGPIIIGDRTKISPFVVLRGPVYIGSDCTINSFCEIKDGACIGDVCKVGGEIECSIIQGFTNKQHFGFLGHSFVGEWVNLGAGTTNSDLKNTYGNIKMQRVPTGQQFLGCVIGDYSKSSVMTSIYTGKVLGVNSLLYGAVTSDVPSFTNFVAPYKDMVEVPLAVAQKVQGKIFARRKVTQSAVSKKLLEDVFTMTKEQRKAFNVKKGTPNP